MSRDTPTADELLADPTTSTWLKTALQSALARDPVDATNDAELLARVLEHRVRGLLEDRASSSP